MDGWRRTTFRLKKKSIPHRAHNRTTGSLAKVLYRFFKKKKTIIPYLRHYFLKVYEPSNSVFTCQPDVNMSSKIFDLGNQGHPDQWGSLTHWPLVTFHGDPQGYLKGGNLRPPFIPTDELLLWTTKRVWANLSYLAVVYQLYRFFTQHHCINQKVIVFWYTWHSTVF